MIENKKHNVLIIVMGVMFIVVASLVVYVPALRGGFIWDDDAYVEKNHLLSAPNGLWNIWIGKGVPMSYVPMVYTVFRLEYALWGLNPFGYHLTNVLLHAVNSLLIWLLLSRLRVRGAWFVSAIFALHPVHTESVAWITELKNVLSLFFCLLATIAYVKYAFGYSDESTKGKGETFYQLSTFLFICALAAKTAMCFFPFSLLILLWWKHGRITLKDIRDLSRFFALALAWGLFILWWENKNIGTGEVELGLTFIKRILIASHALWFYLGKLFYPVNLTFSYPKWVIEPTNPLNYTWLLLCLVTAWGIWHWRKKLQRGSVAAVAFFIVALSPMIGFFSCYTYIYTYVADHYQYVASIGPITLFVAIGCIAVKRSGKYANAISVASVVLILSTLGTLTWRQCHIYKDRETLWRDIIEKNPGSLMAHLNLGIEYRRQGKLDEAIGQLKRLLQLSPDYPKAHYNLGVVYLDKGDLDEASSCFLRVLEIEPNHAEAYNGLGLVFYKQGRFDTAISYFQRALQIEPELSGAHNNLGNAFMSQGDFEQAMHHYSEAIRMEPGFAMAHYNLGSLLDRKGSLDEAIREYIKALEINPDFAQAKAALAAAQTKKLSQDY
jgi:Tfp pilus assembly protein PilF